MLPSTGACRSSSAGTYSPPRGRSDSWAALGPTSLTERSPRLHPIEGGHRPCGMRLAHRASTASPPTGFAQRQRADRRTPQPVQGGRPEMEPALCAPARKDTGEPLTPGSCSTLANPPRVAQLAERMARLSATTAMAVAQGASRRLEDAFPVRLPSEDAAQCSRRCRPRDGTRSAVSLGGALPGRSRAGSAPGSQRDRSCSSSRIRDPPRRRAPAGGRVNTSAPSAQGPRSPASRVLGKQRAQPHGLAAKAGADRLPSSRGSPR